ncbi:hypothetical protein [Brevundimonas pishanensis]|uniref:hypothetical protein n=1 Tax=Brevundimonas pishanensis TaxID=2896315 RepID=UPI001FA7A7A3|nr:hypothetical protein [Brevundimonas pishanensis]
MSIVERLRRVWGLKPDPAPALGEVEPDDELELPEGLPEQIRTVEQAALAIYQRHGLPTAPVSYLRKGADMPWEPLPEKLTPPEKWALLNSAPRDASWRYGDRAVVGRHHEIAEVRNASTLLATCDSLRRRLEGHEPVSAQDISDAMLLGTAAGVLMTTAHTPLSEHVEPIHVPLTFIAVDDED